MFARQLQRIIIADQGQNDFFVTGSEDGTVCMYSLETYTLEKILTRSTLPIRDLAISRDGRWVAVASEYVRRVLSLYSPC